MSNNSKIEWTDATWNPVRGSGKAVRETTPVRLVTGEKPKSGRRRAKTP